MDAFTKNSKKSIYLKKISASLYLMRPANVVTAFADILAGFSIAAIPAMLLHQIQIVYELDLLLLLLLSTAGLYAGGVVFNDACDAELDRIERPERPIPQGIISKRQATIMAFVLFAIGISAAFFVNVISGILATTIVFLCFTYDAYTKHFVWLGPINMGLCRGFNLLLGMSIVVSALTSYWMLMIIPLVFIAAITLISQGEVNGGDKRISFIVFILYLITIITLFILVITKNFHLLSALPYLILFASLALYSLIEAIQTPEPKNIRKAVKTGIICLIILDAALAAGYGCWWCGLLILLLLPISFTLAKKFSVT